MKIHISSSPKLICHCLLLVSQTGQKTGMKLRGPKCLRVCVCGPRFCGLHFYHSFAARVLWGVTFGPGCLLINDRQDKHANNLIKFAVNNKIPTHITWPNFNRALINNRVLVEGGMFHGSLGTWQFIKWQNGKKENKLWALLKKCQP